MIAAFRNELVPWKRPFRGRYKRQLSIVSSWTDGMVNENVGRGRFIAWNDPAQDRISIHHDQTLTTRSKPCRIAKLDINEV